jgi:hypothetical protein
VAAGGIAPFLISETARAETLAPASLQGLHFRRAAPVGAGFKPAPSDDSRRYAPSAVSVGAGFKPAPTEDKLQTGEACLAPMADQGTPAPPAPPESSAAEAVAVVQPAGSPRRSGPRQRRRMPTR